MIEVRLDPGQLAELASMIAEKLRAAATPAATKPYTVAEAAQALGVSESTIVRRVRAGQLRCVPGLGRTLIPAATIADLLGGMRPNSNPQNDE
jgi:excisionase family DNA binding protein